MMADTIDGVSPRFRVATMPWLVVVAKAVHTTRKIMPFRVKTHGKTSMHHLINLSVRIGSVSMVLAGFPFRQE
jgi:hypothetical protein